MDPTLDAEKARSLSPADYLDFTGVDHYFRDVTLQLLKCRSDRPLDFMLAVSRVVACQGRHITDATP